MSSRCIKWLAAERVLKSLCSSLTCVKWGRPCKGCRSAVSYCVLSEDFKLQDVRDVKLARVQISALYLALKWMADNALPGCSRAHRNLMTSGVQHSMPSLCITAARACSQGTKLVARFLFGDLRGAFSRVTWQPSCGCALSTLWKALHTLGNCQKHS